jgi:FG-GAP repeat
MRRVAVVIVLVLITGTLFLAAGPSAHASSAAQPDPGPGVLADFNGDGAADLAVGVPGESVGAVEGAGSVNILYGSTGAGLSGTGSQLFTQAASGGAVEAGDSFGAALASGDFDGDGITDLAVGAPFEDVGSVLDAGAVSVLFGTATGLSAGGVQFTQSPSAPEVGDQFGAALAAGDLDDDPADDLVIGAPFESVGGILNAGIIHVAYGPGPVAPAQQFGQPVSAVEDDDTFGFSLATGDVNGDGFDDVVAGAPFEDVGGTVNAGAVSVLDGSAAGVVVAGAQTLVQPVSAVEFDDTFGFSVAAGDFDGGGVDDVAAGAAFEDVGRTFDAGAVSAIDGSATGLVLAGAQTFTQPISAVEVGDAFGFTLAAGDFDDDSVADLAVGAPLESVGTRAAAGAVSALFGSAGGFSAADAQTFTQAPAGVEADDTFGWSLAAGNFDADGDSDLAAGAPFDDVGSVIDAGAVSEVPGSAGGLVPSAGTLFTQNTAGVPSVAELADAFGGALVAGLPTAAPSPATSPGAGTSPGSATARLRQARGT